MTLIHICRGGTTDPQSRGFGEDLQPYFQLSRCALQHGNNYVPCWQLDASMLFCHLCIDGWLHQNHSVVLHPTSTVAQCATHWNRCLQRGITCHRSWETIGNTLKSWYLWLREMRRRDRKQDSIRKIKWLQPQKASSGMWSASPWQWLWCMIFLTPSIVVD